jgi:hypothetical protein
MNFSKEIAVRECRGPGLETLERVLSHEPYCLVGVSQGVG